MDNVVEVGSGPDGDTEEYKQDEHRNDAPDDLATVVMEVITQESQS